MDTSAVQRVFCLFRSILEYAYAYESVSDFLLIILLYFPYFPSPEELNAKIRYAYDRQLQDKYIYANIRNNTLLQL